ncbi:hypothetical protein MYIN104542_24265 [Mycobacterium intermedium]
MTNCSSAWSISAPEKSWYRMVALIGVKSDSVSNNVTYVPEPPKSSSATAFPSGMPSSEFTAVRAATVSGTSRGAMPLRTNPMCVRRPLRSAWAVLAFQYAGTAMEISAELASTPTVDTIASKASTISRAGSCVEPSGDTSGTRSPSRSTKPPINVPGSVSSGSCSGVPTFGAQCGYRVNTVRRVTGVLPLHAATRLVAPIDKPSGSYIERRLSAIGGVLHGRPASVNHSRGRRVCR